LVGLAGVGFLGVWGWAGGVGRRLHRGEATMKKLGVSNRRLKTNNDGSQFVTSTILWELETFESMRVLNLDPK